MKDHKGDIKSIIKKWAIIIVMLGLIVYPTTKLMPLNKKIYSASFALLTSASSGLTILLLVILIDILPKKNEVANKITKILSRPFIWLGRNPLFVFIFMDLLAIIMIKLIIFNEKSIWSWFYHYVFSSWISDHQVCSVVFACFFLVLWTLVSGLLYRKKIFIRL
jgi:predicted acyltransferase